MIISLFSLPIALAATVCNKFEFSISSQNYPLTLQQLPYANTFLDPFLTSTILYAHHDHHHQTYFTNLNSYVSQRPGLSQNTLAELVLKATNDQSLQMYAGGAYNHNLYWYFLTNPACARLGPQGELLKQIEKKWGTYEAFKAEFVKKQLNLFGSGWVWACVNTDGNIEVRSTKNQLNPLMGVNSDVCYPFLGNDVWEHAYYLKYMWDRGSYVQAFFGAIDWDTVEMFYLNFASQKKAIPI